MWAGSGNWGGVGVADWLQMSPESSAENNTMAEVLDRGGWDQENGEAINPVCSPGLLLLLHVGRGDKLIMWLRLIR